MMPLSAPRPIEGRPSLAVDETPDVALLLMRGPSQHFIPACVHDAILVLSEWERVLAPSYGRQLRAILSQGIIKRYQIQNSGGVLKSDHDSGENGCRSLDSGFLSVFRQTRAMKRNWWGRRDYHGFPAILNPRLPPFFFVYGFLPRSGRSSSHMVSKPVPCQRLLEPLTGLSCRHPWLDAAEVLPSPTAPQADDSLAPPG
jgi:hypothetical protein